MDKLVIQGGHPFSGSVQIAGAKNAALPILAASLLGGTQVSLANVPHVSDVTSMLELLRGLGAEVGPLRNGRLSLSTADVLSSETTYDIVRRMRAHRLALIFCNHVI